MKIYGLGLEMMGVRGSKWNCLEQMGVGGVLFSTTQTNPT